jgi:NADP-dependent 3-hydroxy acid dehydrogenase YdfG
VESVTVDFPETALAEKAVIVSGGTTGIGRAIAIALASEGASVLVFGRNERHLSEAVDEIQSVAVGPEVVGMIADQSEPTAVQEVFEKARREFGGLDILINNAGIPGDSVEDSDENWQYVMQTNLLGCMWCCDEAVPMMKGRGGGHIVNIGSLSAKSRGPGSDVYVASKSGMRGFTESLSKGVAPDNIRVTLIEPGRVSTNFFDWSLEEGQRKTERGEAMKSEDIAACVLFALKMPARCQLTMLQVRPSKDFD